ncbi:MAG TPA: amino acid racemase, partial [Rhizomicrobium sp.]
VHSAKALLWSFDLAEIEALQAAQDWKAAAQRMREAATALARGGADFLIICCNTMHILADAVEDASGLPLLHIATPLGAAIATNHFRKVGVLGTRYTITADFLRSPLVRDHSIEIIAPGEDDAQETHRLIYEELSRGAFLDSSATFLRSAIQRLADRGAEGVILGCTELSLLVKPEESEIPLFDTAELHALAAVDRALA